MNITWDMTCKEYQCGEVLATFETRSDDGGNWPTFDATELTRHFIVTDHRKIYVVPQK